MPFDWGHFSSLARLLGALVVAQWLLAPAQWDDGGQCPVPVVAFTGDSPRTQCGVDCAEINLPARDQCRYNVSGCLGVKAGTRCEVSCQPPYVGEPTIATCPSENSRLDGPPVWTAPDCDLPQRACPAPVEVPAGYILKSGVWGCASTHRGKAQVRCVPDDNCVARIELTGCLPLVPCAPPEVDQCMLDASRCVNVTPDSSCQVLCKPPYSGLPSRAVCLPGNTDPKGKLIVVDPKCILSCQPPVFPPLGYARVGTDFRCAEGFGGEALNTCVMDASAGCVAHMELSGCLPLQRCAVPPVDRCKYDFSDCINTKPGGGTCQVRCRAPYTGAVTRAVCPAGNTNASREFNWTDPNCQLSCAQVAKARIGYMQHPYQMTKDGWQCVANFAGQATVSCTTTEDCYPVLQLSGCLPVVRCAQPPLTPLDLCMYNVLPCLFVLSGRTCNVTCKPPYYGGVGQPLCPAGNTDPKRQLIWRPPKCQLVCQDPNPPPPGYFKNEDGDWECMDGYTGAAEARCTTDLSCSAVLLLTGCHKLVSCIIPPRLKTACHLDWSDCVGLEPNNTCTVRCKYPWVLKPNGNFSTAACPEGNINVTRALTFDQEPNCEIRCDEVPSVSAYRQEAFQCAPGFAGEVTRNCTTNAACMPQYVFSGCLPLKPCVPPQLEDLDICKYDISDCLDVMPGETCEVRCREPHYGDPLPAHCPEGNTNAAFPLLWVPPRCELPCKDSDPAPPGYVHLGACGWMCADGYLGNASKICSVNMTFSEDEHGRNFTQCSRSVEFTGCDALVNCAPLLLNDTCRLNASDCRAVPPGGSCTVRCRPPLVGKGAVAFCPPDNVDPFRPPIAWNLVDDCQYPPKLACPAPDPLPPGYAKNTTIVSNVTTITWVCANGWIGRPVTGCQPNSTATQACSPQITFSGCLRKVPCTIPPFQKCQFDVSACGQAVPYGSSCRIACKPPYSPTRTTQVNLSCPVDNTNASAIIWAQPNCDLGCSDPQTGFQPGYLKLGDMWICADGWLGLEIWSSCEVNSACAVVPTLHGCTQMVPCAPLVLEGNDDLMIDASQCAKVPSGESCNLRCRSPPYVFASTRATCPAGNTNPKMSLAWAPPVCRCPPPDPPPDGYIADWRKDGSWKCTKGYLGTAVYVCIPVNKTYATAYLTGCKKIVDCAPPVLKGPAACQFDVSNCSYGVEPSGTCDVGCKSPYTGNGTQAVCPATNTNPDHPPGWGDYKCDLQCPMQRLPTGYEVGKVQCAPGYRGTPQPVCRGTPRCTAMLDLAGCDPLTPCQVPEVLTLTDTCRWNFQACVGLRPGEFCDVRCKQPFIGEATRAMCRPDNVDPLENITWSEPLCKLPCLIPDPIPPAYVRVPCRHPPYLYLNSDESEREIPGWRCAPGYIGTAVAKCGITPFCRSFFHLTGCVRAQNCTVQQPTTKAEACRLNYTRCYKLGLVNSSNGTNASGGNMTSIIADILSRPATLLPGESCVVTCKAPYTGTGGVATCPLNNTVNQSGPRLPTVQCDLVCPDPRIIPVGYAKQGPKGFSNNGEEWKCAPGYGGQIVARCLLNNTDNCSQPYLNLSGCSPEAACAPLKITDACRLDVSACENLRPNQTCSVPCKDPYVGITGTARCPAGNADSTRQPDLVGSNCSLVCQDPNPVPPAFVKVGSTWKCAPNTTGTASVRCVVDATCTAQLVLTGCLLLQPCVPKPSDWQPCRMVGCAAVPTGGRCNSTCLPPFVGPSVAGSCPALNTNPSQEPIWAGGIPPWCDCPEPTSPPPGYLKNHSTWLCAPGYHGAPALSCPGCSGELVFQGCALIVPCAPPEHDLFLTNQTSCLAIEPGDVCNANCVSTPCVTGGPVQFVCPLRNTDPTRLPDVLQGSCSVACQVCSVDDFVDTDGRFGVISGVLRFGPVHKQGHMEVLGIDGYRVYFADDCGLLVGTVLGYVARGNGEFGCCLSNAYEVVLDEVSVPPGATQLMVALVGSADSGLGELPHGVAVPFMDAVRNVTVVKRTTTSASRRPATLAPFLLLVLRALLR